MKKKRNRLKLIIKNKEFVVLFALFLIALLFFIWQHSNYVGWDFRAYVLNAKYWFADGNYFEWSRPPLVPLLLGLFSFLGWKASEYIFIIFVCSLHFFSSIKFAEKFKVNKLIFYALSLSPFVLIMGISEATELLSLALLQLFLAFIGTKKAPLFLGLAFLTRYPNLIFVPLLLFIPFFTKSWKKFARDIFIFLLIISPWFLFNFFISGNAFTSFMDSYALNIKFRKYIYQPFDINDFILVTNYLLPFFITGLIIKSKNSFKHKEYLLSILLFISFFVLALISYINTPIKLSRYLFPVLLPIVYFASYAVERLRYKFIIIFLLLVLSFSSAFFIHYEKIRNSASQNTYLNIINEVYPYIANCGVSSNAYINLNYFGITSEKYPRKEILGYNINQGYRVLMLKFINEPDYIKNETFLKQFPLLKETENYILLGDKDKCAQIKKINQTYLESISEFYKVAYNKSFSISFYELFFTNKIG